MPSPQSLRPPIVRDLCASDWQFARADSSKRLWLPAMVPGTIHLDLMAQGDIPDPFVGVNEHALAWVGETDWLYRTRFDVPPEALRHQRVELAFDGLDTLADIRMNGHTIGSADNMFVPCRFDAKRLLKPGENELEIRFRSAVIEAQRLQKKNPLSAAGGPYTLKLQSHVRKAAYSYGWDWGPALPTCGVWRPARLEARSGGRIVSSWIETVSLSASRARVTLAVEAERLGAGDLSIETRLHGHGFDRTVRWPLPAGRKRHVLRHSISVPSPKPWWPNGAGEPDLYTLDAAIESGDTAIDAVSRRVGIRTVFLERKPSGGGESFIFKINGQRIYAKGANWIPADSFLPRVTRTRYDALLTQAASTHMNMIRIWGGGIYEDPAFYELCDEKGLMVWQDFMFSCAEYPESPAFLRNVRHEAEEAVRRLRSHPSLALWCGNNECQMMYMRNTGDPMKGGRIYHELLPEVCAAMDPSRPYWPGSPWGGPQPNADTHGDQHYWNVWHGAGDPENYLQSQCRFVSEFGMQSLPHIDTLRECIPPGELYDGSPAMNNHNKGGSGAGKVARYTATVLPLPRDIDEYAWFSQIMQARAIRMGVEHWRRMAWHNAGALIWQFNDCWPVASWSMIDSAGRPKALWYASRRFFAPLLIGAGNVSRKLHVAVSNDTNLAMRGTAICRAVNVTDGSIAFERTFENLAIKANGTTAVCHEGLRDMGITNAEMQFLWMELRVGKLTVAANHFDPVPFRYMPLGEIELKVDARKADGGAAIMLETPATARAVTLSLEDAAVDGTFDDNFIDLYPNRPVTVNVATKASVKDVRKALRVRYLRWA